jgi:hypothetical protein
MGIVLIPSTFAMFYTAKDGDVLSKIAQSHLSGPVYGQNGSLAKILKLNPFIKNADVLFTGQKIELEDLVRVPAKETTPSTQDELKPQASEESISSTVPSASKNTEKELVFNAHASYGAAFMGLSQSGAFGSISGSSIAVNRTDVEVSAKLEDFSGDVEFSRYSLDMGNDTANTTSKENQSLNELTLKGGYKNLLFGFRSKSSPLFKAGPGTTLQWASLTSLSALIDYHLEHEWTGPSLRPYRVSLDTEASVPFSGGSDTGVDISSLNGYALRARGRLEKTLLQGNGLKMLAGLEAVASYDHVQYNGNWGGTSGSVRRNLTEVQGSLGITLEW